jgi:peptide/nickel transport system ATP-binding protein
MMDALAAHPTGRLADALRLDKLSVSYGRVPILRDVSFSVAAGECFGLVGESGCGKSTAAFAAMRALPRAGRITGGGITMDGQDVLALSPRGLRALWAKRVSMVYQDPSRALNPTITIGAQLMEAFAVLGFRDVHDRAEDMLARVQIPSPSRVMSVYPHQLSGGTQQRVVIAMALAKNPALLVMDEPTTGLDATVEAEILDLVDLLRHEQGSAVLLISHNLPMVARMCDRIGVLYAGSLVETGDAGAVLRSPRHPYTARLLCCLPSGGLRKQDGALQTIAGQLPAPGTPTPACVFAPRCDRAEAICHTTPPLEAWMNGHMAKCHFAPPFPASPDAAADGRHAGPCSETPVLTATNLNKTYAAAGGPIRAVTDINLALCAGETLGLVGESGSGKTTLARLLLGLTAPDPGGSITLDGKPLGATLTSRTRAQRQALQIIFQNPDSALNRAHRIRHILGRPLARLAGLSGPGLQSALAALAKGVRLGDAHLAMRPRALSGGLKQRAAIARAFAGRPRVVICDEPTSALDVSVQAAILNLLADLQRREQVAYVFISHDLAVVRYLADRIAVMYLGHLLEVGPAEEVLAGPHHPYTAALVSAATASTRIRLKGEIPRPGEAPSGCIFQRNCPRKIGAICETTAPPFEPGDRHPIRCHIAPGELPRVG